MATTDDVVTALVALGDQGVRTRWTADLMIDAGEVRALLREDDQLLALLTEGAHGATGGADDLLGRVADLDVELDRHAVLLDVGADRSGRWAVESDGSMWLDVRVRSDRDARPDDALTPFDLTVQGRLDLDAVAARVDEDGRSPGMADALARLEEDLAATRGELTALLPAVEPLFDLVTDLLAGRQVAVAGEVDPRAWASALAPVLGGTTADAEEQLRALLGQRPGTSAGSLDVTTEQLLRTVLSFDGFRTDGGDTVVDVGVEVREGGAFLLDQYDRLLSARPDDAAAAGDGPTPEDLDRARAALEQGPERFEDVATLRFDADGRLRQVQVPVLDLAARLGAAADPDDDDLATVVDALSRLERTGLVVTVDLTDHGAVPSVLSDDATTTLTWDQLREVAAAGAGMLGALGGLGGLDGDGGTVGEASALLSPGYPRGLRPDQLAVGDCFDDEALDAPAGTGTTVPCDQPHDNEVFALLEVGSGNGMAEAEQMNDLAADCAQPFEEYVGTPPDQSGLLYRLLEPSRSQWQDQGVRTFACYLYTMSPGVGSAAGSGR